jgi:predicted nuclease of restriction endonuclease-like RecB superfamily
VDYAYESCRIPYVLTGHYIPDFILNTSEGTRYIECKGYLRPEHKRKMIAVKKCNPLLDIRLVFYAFNKKYIKWAEKNGFPWAVEMVPKEWLI